MKNIHIDESKIKNVAKIHDIDVYSPYELYNCQNMYVSYVSWILMQDYIMSVKK